MHQIQLNEQLYQEAQRRAAEAGFGSVDEYVAVVLQHDLDDECEKFDSLFTPGRLAHIDRAAAEIDAGRGMTPDGVDAELNIRRTAWLDDRR